MCIQARLAQPPVPAPNQLSYILPMQAPTRKKLPYAVSNFEEILEEGYYVVDKTSFIRELEIFKVPVFLRPRRFGKTLWCSTLECYYDIGRKARFESLFGNLAIGKNPTPLRNSFMVLRLNFSVVQVSFDLDVLERNFTDNCLGAFGSLLIRYRAYFKDGLTLDPSKPAAQSLESILQFASAQGLPPIYLIIDEYDNFVNQLITSKREDLYGELTSGDSFFRTFFKGIKAGCETRAIGKVFITGVLPITMDDLTSGFNIAEIVTLEPALHNMQGFTQSEVHTYLETVVRDHDLSMDILPETLLVVKNYYNGYRFLPDAPDSLYNATILTYFLKYFANHKGQYPRDMIDSNVKTDVSWIERLGFGGSSPLDLMETLLQGEGLPYDNRSLTDKFNMRRFFETNHYPASLFFLGMLSAQDETHLCVPNQTIQSILADYYNTLARIEVADGYGGAFSAFRKDLDLSSLFGCYHKVYLGQIVAQAFDKVNENFVRLTFFELCSRYLSQQFSFAIEAQYPSGRSDWELLGRPDSIYKNQKWIVEFKYLSKSNKAKLTDFDSPPADAVAQVEGYKAQTLADFPQYTVHTAVCVVQGRDGFKWWDL